MEKDLTISLESTIVEALKKLDKTAEKVLFVTNKNRKLLGALSDGDIRRYILSKGEENNFSCVCLHKNWFDTREFNGRGI